MSGGERQKLNMIFYFLSQTTNLKIWKKEPNWKQGRRKQEFDFGQAELAFQVIYDSIKDKYEVWKRGQDQNNESNNNL